MGSAAGVEKTAAARIGVSLDEYRGRRALGHKWCRLCSEWRAVDEFGTDRTRGDGRAMTCLVHRHRTDAPSIPRRAEMRETGFSWCRDCEAWLPLDDIRNGRCIPHDRERERQWYRDGGHVYRLSQAARRRGVEPVPADVREEDLAEGCAYCGDPADAMDHVIPVARGGVTERGNIVPACTPCNSRKRDQDPLLWIDRLSATWQENLLFHLIGDGAIAELLDL